MAKDKSRDKDKTAKRKKYSKPKVTRHGSLQGIAERVTGVKDTTCCVTARARAALRSPGERRRLVQDIADILKR